MPTEIEAKIKVPDLAAVRTTLQAAGATRIASELETNSFFDTPDRSLQSSDKGLRLRIAVDETGKSRCTVTMKGPLQKARFKTREETEFSADDSRAVRKMLENLGYQLTLSFEKRRETWAFSGCEVALDELPYLGTYVEIEAKSASDVAAARDVSAARDALGLADLPLISTGYISLLASYLQQRQIKDRLVRF
ncbi:MAG: class IV adenylate cyclase [Tepidisphaeraceae bacterium]|jgi:adenylate cyclase, class 2